MKKARAIRFRPTLWPSLATLLLLPALTGLGVWQLDRAEQKREILALYTARGASVVDFNTAGKNELVRYQRVRVKGRYDSERQFLLDAMPGSAGAGYHVLSLLRPANGEPMLLVDRGWIPAGDDRSALPRPALPQGELVLSGRLATLPRPGIRLEETEAGRGGWPRLLLFPEMETLERALGEPLYPLILWLDADLAGGFERDWRPVGAGPEKHIAYAVQWFGLAGALLVIFLLVNVERENAKEDQGVQ